MAVAGVASVGDLSVAPAKAANSVVVAPEGMRAAPDMAAAPAVAVGRLNLGLLIDTEHDGLVGRVPLRPEWEPRVLALLVPSGPPATRIDAPTRPGPRPTPPPHDWPQDNVSQTITQLQLRTARCGRVIVFTISCAKGACHEINSTDRCAACSAGGHGDRWRSRHRSAAIGG